MSAIEDGGEIKIEITDDNFLSLSQLSREFGFDDLSDRLYSNIGIPTLNMTPDIFVHHKLPYRALIPLVEMTF